MPYGVGMLMRAIAHALSLRVALFNCSHMLSNFVAKVLLTTNGT